MIQFDYSKQIQIFFERRVDVKHPPTNMRNPWFWAFKKPQKNCWLAMSPLPPQPSWVAKTPTPEVPPYYSPAAPPWRPAGLKPLSESLVFLSQVGSWWWDERGCCLRCFFLPENKRCVFFLDESCCWFWRLKCWMKVFFVGWDLGMVSILEWWW